MCSDPCIKNVVDMARFVGATWILFNKINVFPNVLCYTSGQVIQMRSVRGSGCVQVRILESYHLTDKKSHT